MCDKCQMSEIRVRGLRMILDELRQVLSLEDGQGVVDAVKALVKDSKQPKNEILGLRGSPFTQEERDKVMEMITKFNIPVRQKDGFKRRIQKLANLEEIKDSEEYEFILQMKMKVTK